MKALSPALAAHLAGGATTMSWCWRLTRRDGVVLGFTDHDRDIVVDGTTFEAASGFTASQMSDQVGLSVDNLEVASALRSDRLGEIDLSAGRFDEAVVEIFYVNWQDTTQWILLRKGSLGGVTRGNEAFSAEIRGLSHYLQEPSGRLFQFTCDAALGDARCGVDLTKPAFVGTGSIARIDDLARLAVTGVSSFAAGWFDSGLLTVTSGSAAGLAFEIKRQAFEGPLAIVELWLPLSLTPAVGDTVKLTAGCDKTVDTCASKFANAANFRGFPNMPGNDFVSSYVISKS